MSTKINKNYKELKISDFPGKIDDINRTLGNIYKPSSHPFEMMGGYMRYTYNIASGRFNEDNFENSYLSRLYRRRYAENGNISIYDGLDFLGLNTREIKPTINPKFQNKFKTIINSTGKILDDMIRYISPEAVKSYINKNEQIFVYNSDNDGVFSQGIFGGMKTFLDPVVNGIINPKYKKTDYFSALLYIVLQSESDALIFDKVCKMHKTDNILTLISQLAGGIQSSVPDVKSFIRDINIGATNIPTVMERLLEADFKGDYLKPLKDGKFSDAMKNFNTLVSSLQYIESYMRYHYIANFGDDLNKFTESDKSPEKQLVSKKDTKPKENLGSSLVQYKGEISQTFQDNYKASNKPSQDIANLQVTLMYSIFTILPKDKIGILLNESAFNDRFVEIMKEIIATNKVPKVLNDGYFGPLTLQLLQLFRYAFVSSGKTPKDITLVDSKEFTPSDNRAISYVVGRYLNTKKGENQEVEEPTAQTGGDEYVSGSTPDGVPDIRNHIQVQLQGLTEDEQRKKVFQIYKALGVKNLDGDAITRILKMLKSDGKGINNETPISINTLNNSNTKDEPSLT